MMAHYYHPVLAGSGKLLVEPPQLGLGVLRGRIRITDGVGAVFVDERGSVQEP